MVDGFLRRRGLRERSEVELLSPLNRAFTIESASKLIQPIMEQRGIGLTTFFNVEAVDPAAHIVESLEGEKTGVRPAGPRPAARGRRGREASDLGDAGGWLPTDRTTLHVDGTRAHLRARRRDRPADLEVRVDRPLRGAGDREPHRLARHGHRPDDELRRPGDVLPRDRRRQGDRRCGSTTSTRRSRRSPTGRGTWRSGSSTACIGRPCRRAGSPNELRSPHRRRSRHERDHRTNLGPEGPRMPAADREDRASDP